MVSWSPLKVLLIRSWHIQGKRPLRQYACCLQHSSVVGPNKGPHSCSTQDFDKGWRKRIILYRTGLTSNTVIVQSSELHEQYQQPGERDLLTPGGHCLSNSNLTYGVHHLDVPGLHYQTKWAIWGGFDQWDGVVVWLRSQRDSFQYKWQFSIHIGKHFLSGSYGMVNPEKSTHHFNSSHLSSGYWGKWKWLW